MFATDGTDRDPVAVSKLFARKRPEEMNQDDAPFYLVVNNWFKSVAVGNNQLNGSLATMFRKAAGIQNDTLLDIALY